MIYLGNGMYSDSGPDTLSHYGRKGMKWGQHIFGDEDDAVKKYGYSRDEAHRRLNNTDAFYKKHINKKNRWLKPYNKAADLFNAGLPDINKKYNDKDLTFDVTDFGIVPHNEKSKNYISDIDKFWKKCYDSSIDDEYGEYARANLIPSYNEQFPFRNMYELAPEDKQEKHLKELNIYHSENLDMSQVLMSDLTDSEYLEHYGRLGMKWGQHIFGDDESHISRRQKRKEAKLQKKNQKLEAKRQRKEEKKRKRKIPKTAAALARRMDSLTDEEFEEAYKNIRKRAAVKDAAISDAYRLERVLNYPNVFLNDATNAAKNIDYWRWKLSGQGTVYPSGFHLNTPQKTYSIKSKPSAKNTSSPAATKATIPNDPFAGFTVYEQSNTVDPRTGKNFDYVSFDQESKYDSRGNFMGDRRQKKH